jgi:hypothetical protein
MNIMNQLQEFSQSNENINSRILQHIEKLTYQETMYGLSSLNLNHIKQCECNHNYIPYKYYRNTDDEKFYIKPVWSNGCRIDIHNNKSDKLKFP